MSKHFGLDCRFVFKSRLKQPVHIMAFALLFCAITLPIQWYNPLIALSGVCPMHLAFCDLALVLFLAEITLYSAFHLKLSFSF